MPVIGFLKAGQMSDDSLSLSGCSILVTRPQAQSANLLRLIREAEGNPIAFPLIQVEPVEPVNLPASANTVIVVSANAAHAGHTYIKQLDSVIIAVGTATAAALQSYGIEPAYVDTGDNSSESLLKAGVLANVAGQTVIIVRGEGGRGLLADGLRERGAEVSYLEVYRRVPARADVKILYESMLENRLDIVTVTSVGILEQLLEICTDDLLQSLRALPVLVISERIARRARESGFVHVIVCRPGDANMLSALQVWWQQTVKENNRD